MIDDEVIDPTSTAIFGVFKDENLQTLASLSEEDKAAVKALPHGSALLLTTKGHSVGSRFLLNNTNVSVGRNPDSDIFLDDVTVSRKHAVFIASEDGYLIRDTGSLNGVYVNGQLVDEKLLSSGDEVQVGKFRLTYHSSIVGANVE